MSETHKHYWRYIDEDNDSDLGVCACGATGVIYFGNGEVLDIKTREQHDSLLAEVERLRGERDTAIAQMNVAIASTKYRGAPRQELLDRIASLEADNAQVLALGERFGFEHKPWTVGQVITHAEYLQQERARLLYLSMTQGQQLHQLEADNARLVSEQQHCAKCGGVECHALAGLFCGGHSYEGCGEWGGCPICENAKLKSALAASGSRGVANGERGERGRNAVR